MSHDHSYVEFLSVPIMFLAYIPLVGSPRLVPPQHGYGCTIVNRGSWSPLSSPCKALESHPFLLLARLVFRFAGLSPFHFLSCDLQAISTCQQEFRNSP